MASVKIVPCALHSPTFQPCEQVAISLNATQKRDFRAGKKRIGQGPETARTKGRKDTRAGQGDHAFHVIEQTTEEKEFLVFQ